jgi:hypothetical protein
MRKNGSVTKILHFQVGRGGGGRLCDPLVGVQYTDSHRNNKELKEACRTGHILG